MTNPTVSIRWQRGWTAIPNKLIRDTGLSRNARHLWTILASFAGNDEQTTPKRQDEILHWLAEGEKKPDRTSLYRWTKELEANHWILVHHSEQGIIYELLDGTPPEPNETPPPPCCTPATYHVAHLQHLSINKTPELNPPPPTPSQSTDEPQNVWARGEGEGGAGEEQERGAQPEEYGALREGGWRSAPASAAPPATSPTAAISRDEWIKELQRCGVDYASKLQCEPTRASLNKARKMAQSGTKGGAIYNYLKEYGADLTDDTPQMLNTDYQQRFKDLLDQNSISYGLEITVNDREVSLMFPAATAAAALQPHKELLISLVRRAVGFEPQMQWRVPATNDAPSSHQRNKPRNHWAAGGAE